MISKKAIIAWVFSAAVGVGMLAVPSRVLAHDNDGDGRGHQQWQRDNGEHRGWSNHRDNDGDEHRGYNLRPYGNNYGYGNGYRYGNQEPDADDGYGWNQPNYGYQQPRYGYSYPSNGAGMVNRRNPNLVWTCDSQGHHCHWAQRYGSNGFGVNPFAFSGYNNGYGSGYYGGNSGYYGNSMGGLGSLLGPLFGGPQP